MKDYSPTLSHWIINFTFRSTMYYLRNWKFFSVFPYIYRNTSWSLWEREIPVGTRVISSDYLVFYFFYIKKNRKLKCGNSFRYQSVNSPYCWWWRMRYGVYIMRESFHAFHKHETVHGVTPPFYTVIGLVQTPNFSWAELNVN